MGKRNLRPPLRRPAGNHFGEPLTEDCFLTEFLESIFGFHDRTIKRCRASRLEWKSCRPRWKIENLHFLFDVNVFFVAEMFTYALDE